ncbi:RNA polymerase I specific transcription initiation factor RRN3 [Aphelenchoides besseyi]|nr:RNA polymerase I specific transcription initiation factor RRN3 [Aphelenchoides besseyi]
MVKEEETEENCEEMEVDEDSKVNVVKLETKNKTLTAAEVLNRFSRYAHGNLEYYQLCKVWRQVGNWREEVKINFISDFFGTSDVFNQRFVEMVSSICELRWYHVPESIRPKFVDFLVEIALYNTVHAHLIARACVSNFIPTIERRVNEQTGLVELVPSIPVDEQEPVFLLCIAAINRLFPRSSLTLHVLLSSVRRFKPHKKGGLEETVNFIRLSMILADHYPTIGGELWSGIIECMLILDSEVSQDMKFQLHDIRQIFPKNETEFEFSVDSEMLYKQKLNAAMLMFLCCTSRGPNPEDSPYTKWMVGWQHESDLYSILLHALDTQILWVQESENVPFVWFYLCSLDQEILSLFLQHMWKVVITPVRVPNEWKRAQTAAALISGLLARANFVSFEMVVEWLRRMADWCTSYVDKAGQVKTSAGAHHSTFYATVQALFFTFCFRYKEFIDAEMLDEIRVWGIGKLVHSQLEPLNFVYKPLAMCFASISRYMQIVYCNHIISMTAERDVVAYFPFLRCGLVSCQPFIQPLLRSFVPADEDFGTIEVVRSRRTTETMIDENYEYAWMDDGIDVSDYI